MYYFRVIRNGFIEYTSQPFPTPYAAYDYFLNIDKPVHYAKETFKKSNILSELINERTGETADLIRVQFIKIEKKHIPIEEWDKLCKLDEIC